MRLKLQKRSELKLVSRIIPGAKRRGIYLQDSFYLAFLKQLFQFVFSS